MSIALFPDLAESILRTLPAPDLPTLADTLDAQLSEVRACVVEMAELGLVTKSWSGGGHGGQWVRTELGEQVVAL